MKKRYVFLIILALIVVAVGIFAYVNKDNISAVIHGLTVTEEEIQQKKQETDEKTKEVIKQFGVEGIRPLTEEEVDKLHKGELTEEEAINLVLGKTDNHNTETESNLPPSGETGTKKPSGDKTTHKPSGEGTTTKPSESTGKDNPQASEAEIEEANNRIANLIGKMYVMKSQFTSDLKSVEKWVISEYVKLTPEERKSTAIKTKIGKEAVAKASGLEAKCDGQMETILTEITTLLQKTGQDTGLVKQIREAYEEEKKLAKSYYISKI